MPEPAPDLDDRAKPGRGQEVDRLPPRVGPPYRQRAVVPGEPVSRGEVQQEPRPEPAEATALQVVHDDPDARDARQLPHEPNRVRWLEVVEHERGVRDVIGALGERQGEPVRHRQREARLGSELRLDLERRLDDLGPAVDRHCLDPSPRAAEAGHGQRDVGRAGADVKDPQRVEPEAGGGGGRPKEAQGGSKRQLRATEVTVDPRQVAQVPHEGRAVDQRAVEMFQRAGEPPHRAIMQATGVDIARNRSARSAVRPPMRHLVLGLALLLAGCSVAGPGSTGSPGPTIIPGPSGGATLSEGELRLLLIDGLGPRWYCDPDEYPISHGDAMSRMRERWPEVLADASTLAAILEHEGLPPIVQANLT